MRKREPILALGGMGMGLMAEFGPNALPGVPTWVWEAGFWFGAMMVASAVVLLAVDKVIQPQEPLEHNEWLINAIYGLAFKSRLGCWRWDSLRKKGVVYDDRSLYADNELTKLGEALNVIRDSARNGKIQIWGINMDDTNGDYEMISPAYWQEYNVNIESLWRGEPTGLNTSNPLGITPWPKVNYHYLRINKKQVKRAC